MTVAEDNNERDAIQELAASFDYSMRFTCSERYTPQAELDVHAVRTNLPRIPSIHPIVPTRRRWSATERTRLAAVEQWMNFCDAGRCQTDLTESYKSTGATSVEGIRVVIRETVGNATTAASASASCAFSHVCSNRYAICRLLALSSSVVAIDGMSDLSVPLA